MRFATRCLLNIPLLNIPLLNIPLLNIPLLTIFRGRCKHLFHWQAVPFPAQGPWR